MLLLIVDKFVILCQKDDRGRKIFGFLWNVKQT